LLGGLIEKGFSLELAIVRDGAGHHDSSQVVTGTATTATAIRIGETLLNKPGGYLSNDITPPGVYLDNIPNWEFGALTPWRDLLNALRNDFSRAQSQSVEDKDLAIAQPQSADPQWHRIRTHGQPFAGDGLLYLAGQCRDHRSA
jgi:hypothetical protein